jgi:hypothetical protein
VAKVTWDYGTTLEILLLEGLCLADDDNEVNWVFEKV